MARYLLYDGSSTLGQKRQHLTRLEISKQAGPEIPATSSDSRTEARDERRAELGGSELSEAARVLGSLGFLDGGTKGEAVRGIHGLGNLW